MRRQKLSMRGPKLVTMISVCLLLSHAKLKAQEFPPFPIKVSVNTSQGLNFGAFYLGPAGGNIIINPNGTRFVTGNIVEVSTGYNYSPALFEVESNPGTIISILGSNAVLTGSNGGTMTLQTGDSNPSSPFITTATPPVKTIVSLGGILSVNDPLSSPPGAYSGVFQVTFIQE
jgi:hypothetical protein